MAEFSIIIPVLNEARIIEIFLKRLSPFREKCEIIVVDGGSQDRTAMLARPLCDQLILSRPGRGLQMNTGASYASGGYLLFLHGDTILFQDCDSLLKEVRASDWGFAPIILSGSDWRSRIISRFMVWRSTFTAVATGDQMIFVKSSLFKTIGGFANIPLMEDIEISKRLRKVTSPKLLSRPVITSSRRWRENGYLETVILMWWLRLAYFLGVSPETLARYYYGRK
tara:strand:+ start:641 stop:1315 length:675 start_codon:yes stop_codon:yes gene_type:complete